MGLAYIYVRDGLGNQLFQAALGIALTRRAGVDVRYMTHSYRSDPYGRAFMLDRFANLSLPIARPGEAAGLPVITEGDLDGPRLLERLEEYPAVILDGWWQKESFFLGEHAAIRAAFALTPDKDLAALGARLSAAGTIGAHVRRGDYGHFGLAKASYYRDAIAAIRRERGERPVTFFTDEPNFCTHAFHDIPGMSLAKGNLSNPLADFYLLSRCAHFVIANSSFSWWAAWLGAGAESIIHAPSPWLAFNATYDPVPATWRRTPDALLGP
jgi:hypothetical protein